MLPDSGLLAANFESPRYCLFFSLPFGITVVVGGVGRSEVPPPSLGGEWSFFGFFTILLLRWSPFARMICKQECRPQLMRGGEGAGSSRMSERPAVVEPRVGLAVPWQRDCFIPREAHVRRQGAAAHFVRGA